MFEGIKLLPMSEIDAIKIKEIEAAITFYIDNGLSEKETCEKISSNFDISKDELKKILNEKHTN